MSLSIKTPAADYPVSLEQAKKQCEISTDIDRHDDQLELFIRAATEYVEKVTGRDLVERTWYYRFDRFPSGNGDIVLPRSPVISVESITHTDPNNSPSTVAVASSVWGLDNGIVPSLVYLQYNQSWPSNVIVHNGITIEFKTGYVQDDNSDLAGNVPDDIKAAILLVVSDLFEHREASLEMQVYENPAVEMLLMNNRVFEL